MNGLERAKLAREAARLNRAVLPSLVLFTDDERLPDPLGAIAKLPKGSLVILRARDARRRERLARDVRRVVRRRGLTWLIADDPRLAARHGADGAHFPEARMNDVHYWRARRPGWLITCAAHSLGACARGGSAGADAVFLSPVFATASHPGHSSLGVARTCFVAKLSPLPVYALGGITPANARRLSGAPLAGLAAVGALAV